MNNETNQNKTPANKKQTHNSSILNIEMHIRQAKTKVYNLQAAEKLFLSPFEV